MIHRVVDGDAGGGVELLAANYSRRSKRFMPTGVRFDTMNARGEDVAQRWLLPTRHYYEWLYAPGAAKPER